MPLCIKPLHKHQPDAVHISQHCAGQPAYQHTTTPLHSSARSPHTPAAPCLLCLRTCPPPPRPSPLSLAALQHVKHATQVSLQHAKLRVCQHNAHHHLHVYTRIPTHAAYASQPVPCWSTPVCASYHASIGNLVIVYLVFGGDKGPGEADVRGGLGAPQRFCASASPVLQMVASAAIAHAHAPRRVAVAWA